MPSDPLHDIPLPALRRLAAELAGGGLGHEMNPTALKRAVPNLPGVAIDRLTALSTEGWSAKQIETLVRSAISAYETGCREAHILDLVMSGPKHAAIPMRDTNAVFRELVAEAKTEIIIASYAIYNGSEILKPVAARMAEVPELKVSIFLDMQRGRDANTLPSECVALYRQEFVKKQWPSERLPSLYYFRPSVEPDWRSRASMHAKAVVVDRRRTFLTSANLTKAAHSKNIEIGALIESESAATRLANYFCGLIEIGEFVPF